MALEEGASASSISSLIPVETGDRAKLYTAEGGCVELDEERKAAMVSNLLVVLCGNKDAQPIVNSGSLY